ncbi:Peroxidase superfamily protein [Striga hermonthica]|uniref:Peroxidase n=1 Tax=Striga hermonthica TaxID=68872 RepID=A0A9N7MLV8_STRHE|nr:Peroxidase superfamily protein [Striga hermonthica]
MTTCYDEIESSSSSSSSSKLRVGFYSKSCPKAEAVIHGVVREAAVADENNSPSLLRLHFHDCFVKGCDGSILIDSGAETDERRAFGHQGVRGFEVVERAKAELEKICPRTVSCADIVALAARDAVFLSRGPWYEVETGRRDGNVSNVKFADEMPDVGDDIKKLKAKFLAKGLNEKDLVLLSAAHTIGTTACFFMTQRLYSFPGHGGTDPSINPYFVPELKSTCPKNGDVNARVALDRGSEKTFDVQILRNIRSGLAVLQSDARLYQDVATRKVIDSYLGLLSPILGPSFGSDFAASMVKMGRIGVLTGSKGTIRRVCSSFK